MMGKANRLPCFFLGGQTADSDSGHTAARGRIPCGKPGLLEYRQGARTEETMAVEFKAGLKDVIAVNSSICTVDGEAGKLYYRGYSITDLARYATYEEVVHLLWQVELPTRTQRATLTAVAARTMDMIFVLHADHEINASTFATRVAIATFTDLHSAIVAAIGTLKGPRHGGANEDVLAMLLEIGDPGNAEQYIQRRLLARAQMSHEERAKPENRIPGFGHPVYKVDDPRAGVLREMARQVSQEAGTMKLFDTATKVYETMHRETDLPVNVDFFSAVVYYALGIPIDLCTSIFASARISGWCAHAMEQYHDRLIRPRAHYTGPPPRAFVPL